MLATSKHRQVICIFQKLKISKGEKEAWFKGVQINMHQLLGIPLKSV